MGEIIELSKEIIEKIAAGEIVQDPSSIVKELLENSIDANASQITIELENGGKNLIICQDNGKGMDIDDARKSIKRHATSKITNLHDLDNIRSLGFRGEALASISVVSHMTIQTKHESYDGIELKVEDGKINSEKSIGRNNGTKIIVKNLFYNTPARKKYLKKDATETSKVLNIVNSYALLYYNIGFKLINNNRVLLSAPKTNDLLGKITLIYGTDIAKNLIEVNSNNIHGFISKPSLSRSDRSYQTLFVNKRLVKNNLINKAIYESYRSLLFHGRHPIYVLNISIPYDQTDVNVHPAKLIVKLSNEQILFKQIQNSTKIALENNNLTPKLQEKDLKLFDRPTTKKNQPRKYEFTKSSQSLLQPTIQSEYNILGQIYKTYILVENKQGFSIIDQHAAHERILFEKFYQQYLDKTIETQELIEPMVFEFSPKEFLEFQKIALSLKDFGFDYEEFGGNTIIVRKIPLILKNFSIETFKQLIESPSKFKDGIQDNIQHMIATMACRAAVKAGDTLSQKQINDLLESMNEPKFPYSCPHGRPTAINVTFDDLEKMFKRKE